MTGLVVANVCAALAEARLSAGEEDDAERQRSEDHGEYIVEKQL